MKDAATSSREQIIESNLEKFKTMKQSYEKT